MSENTIFLKKKYLEAIKLYQNYNKHYYNKNEPRSEEHTSELQSQSTISYAVFCLKKKKKKKKKTKNR